MLHSFKSIFFCKKLQQKPLNKKRTNLPDVLLFINMMEEAWSMFPRNMEQKINSLLDQAEPNTLKSFQLYKTCKSENLWRNSFELFQIHLSDYYSQAKQNRAKSYFDQFLDRPLSRAIFDEFELNFRTAKIEQTNLHEIAEWAHVLLKKNIVSNCMVISVDIIMKTLQYITAPPPYEKTSDIEFEDFCIAWKKTVFSLFGKEYDQEFQKILTELRWINRQLKESAQSNHQGIISNKIYLTQTEIDWIISVQSSAFNEESISHFPLSRGPDKERLINLQRTIVLFNMILSSEKASLIVHKDNVKHTILHHCSNLLKDKAS